MTPSPLSHWHATEEGAIELPVRNGNAPGGASIPGGIPPARRMPAAVIGMLLVAAIGFSAVQGWTVWTGQTMAPAQQPDIVLTDGGAEPQTLTVTAGQNVIFRNNASIPQILLFETLIGPNGAPVESSIIHPLSDARVTIPSSIPPGTYPYTSSTSRSVSGTLIVIAAGSVQPQQPLPQERSIPLMQQVPASSAASEPASAVPEPASSVAPPVQPAPTLPVNPYAVGTESVPVPAPQPAGTVSQDVIIHMPQTNAETGSAAWATAVIGLLSLAFVLRRAQV